MVDNPEYHLCIGQTLGIPHPPPLPHQHKSSEEESDHEYYNDFDRLQRELQPLRRNETTVWTPKCNRVSSDDTQTIVVSNSVLM